MPPNILVCGMILYVWFEEIGEGEGGRGKKGDGVGEGGWWWWLRIVGSVKFVQNMGDFVLCCT